MAGNHVSVPIITELRRHLFTDVHAMVATGMELTAGRRVDRTGNIPAQNDALVRSIGIGNGNSGKERFRIRMHGPLEDIIRLRVLHEAAQIHDSYLIGNVLHHGKIVRNKDVRQFHLLLKIFQKVNDLCLNGHIERRNRLIAHNKLRLQRKSGCNADTLTLSAGKLMGITFKLVGRKSAFLHDIQYIRLALALGYEFMLSHRLPDDFSDRHTGRKTGIRILENDLHLRT